MLGVEYSGVAEFVPPGSQFLVTLSLCPPDSSKAKTILKKAVSPSGRQSFAAYVLEVGRPAAVTDWNRDMRFSDELLRQNGIESALAVPLKLEGQSYGALLVGSSRPVMYTDDDLLFAENISYLVSTTVALRKTEEALQEERVFSAGLLDNVGAIVIVLDPDGQVRSVNQTCESVTGFSQEEFQGRNIWEVFPVSESSDLFKVIFDKLLAGISPVEYESSVATKDSVKRHIAWSYSGISGPDGSLEKIIVSGIDISEQRVIEAKLEQLESEPNTRPGFSEPQPAEADSESDEPQTLKPRGGPPSVALQERRFNPRRPYPYRQSIGYVVDGNLPNVNDFQQVDCNDIAANGFSFLSPQPPQSDSLVVALGNYPRLTYLSAQVVHATRVEHEGQHKFLIGCAYVSRVNY
jgi:PAS domain S-box-containing protein